MKKRVISALMSVILVLGLIVPALAATGTVTATIQDGGYYQGNSFGDASISDGYKNCRWMCMEPDGNPPQPGHSFSIEEVGGLYRTFAWMAQVELEKNPHPSYPSNEWERLWNIHHAVAQLNGTNNHVWYGPQQAVYREAENYDTSRIPSDFVAFRGYPSSHGGDQICLFWGRNPPPPESYIRFHKSSTNPGLTNGNPNYSLAGARYDIYLSWSDWVNGNVYTSLTTDANGNTGTAALPATDWPYFYFSEAVAPQGYRLDPQRVHCTSDSDINIPLRPGGTTTIEVSDVPIPQESHLKLKKTSANPDVTNGNSCYSLAGAEYGVYFSRSDAEKDTNRIAKLVTAANGDTATVDITLKNSNLCYVKELKAPKGFALDNSIHEVTLTTGKTVTFEVTDTPTLDPAPVMVKKQSSDGTGGKPLAGAEFTFRFYVNPDPNSDGYYHSVEEAEASGEPLRAWVFRTNKNGVAHYDSQYLVSGDPLYTDKLGDPNLPFGTLLIQETKAPEGYILDPTVQLLQIVPGDDPLRPEATFNAPIVPNVRKGRLVIEKTAINGSAEGWSFLVLRQYNNLWRPVETITTGADGKAYSSFLDEGKYLVREVHDKDEHYWTYDVKAEKIATAINDQDTVVQYTNEQFGRISIKKTMDTDGPLDGWKFHVTGGPDNVDLTLTSGEDGTITSDKLRPGTYTVEEILPKDSLYVCKTENPQTITVVAGETAAVNFTNALRPGRITITKVASDTTQPLPGVKMCLEWSDDGKTWQPVFYSDTLVKGGCSNSAVVDGCLTTGEDGVLVWDNLDPRLTYRLTELETVDGYQLLSGAAWEGKLPSDTVEVSLNVVNSPVFVFPATGRYGFLPFILAGVMGAAVYVLFTKKRKKDNSKNN